MLLVLLGRVFPPSCNRLEGLDPGFVLLKVPWLCYNFRDIRFSISSFSKKKKDSSFKSEMKCFIDVAVSLYCRVVKRRKQQRSYEVSADLEMPMPVGILSGYLTTIFTPLNSKPFKTEKVS